MISTSKARRTTIEGENRQQQYQPRTKLQKTNVNQDFTQIRKVTPIESRRKDSNVNVVVCITGLLSERKNELHDIVTVLGGRFTGELNTDQVTHLIANTTNGSKYEAAVDSNTIWIVKPSWLLECKEKNQFITSERYHLLVDGVMPKNNKIDKNDNNDDPISRLDDIVRDSLPMMNTSNLCNGLLSKDKIEKEPDLSCQHILSNAMSDIFTKCYFYIVVVSRTAGNKCNTNNGGYANDFEIATAEKPTALWYSIGKVIRHGGGTSIWNLNPLITHVIVVRDYLLDHETRNAILQIGIHHPNKPAIVSLDWLIMSFQNNSLQPYHWFQLSKKVESHRSERKKTVNVEKKNDKISSAVKSKKISTASTKSTLFQDYIFYILPILSSTKIDDKYRKSIEDAIITNGGILLSFNTVHIIQRKIQSQKRLFVLHLNGELIIGSKVLHNHIDQFLPHDLPSTKFLSNMVLLPITPVWIKVCLFVHNKEKQKKKHIKSQPCCNPNEHPMLFQPQSWKIKKLPASIAKTFKVSISGFLDIHRYAVIELLKFMNIPFTDTLQKNNTHLIHPNQLKESVRNGSKFKMALEWKLFVVKLDWLYFVMQNGHTIGCEDGFAYRER